MRMRIIGDRRDVAGFGLAGIEGVECTTRQQVAAALKAAARDRSIGLVALSADAAALCEDMLDAMRGARTPIVIVLPPSERRLAGSES